MATDPETATDQPDHVARLLRAMADAMMRSARAVKAVQPLVTERLLARGWFPSYHFHDRLILGLHQLFEDGQVEEVDGVMAEFARRHVDRIEADLRNHFPARTHTLTETFEAHRNRKYALSVRSFLAEADGIGREVLGTGRQHIYKKETYREKGAAVQVRDAVIPDVGPVCRPDSIHGRVLAPIGMKWSLAVTTEERDQARKTDPGYGPLNRHGVLHGVDTDYPTEMNSLRCVLLLGFLLDARQILHDELPERQAFLGGDTHRPPL